LAGIVDAVGAGGTRLPRPNMAIFVDGFGDVLRMSWMRGQLDLPAVLILVVDGLALA